MNNSSPLFSEPERFFPGASVCYDYDQYHHLTTVRTSTDWVPLVTLEYTVDTTAWRTTQLKATDILGRVAETDLNALELPTLDTASSAKKVVL